MTGLVAHLGSVRSFCDRATAAKEWAVSVVFVCMCVYRSWGALWLEGGGRKCMNFDRKEKMNSLKKRDGGREHKGRARLVEG